MPTDVPRQPSDYSSIFMPIYRSKKKKHARKKKRNHTKKAHKCKNKKQILIFMVY